MKPFFLLLSALLGAIPTLFAQAQLTVGIDDLKATDSVWVSVPDFWFNESGSKTLLPATNVGIFSKTLSIDRPRLIYVNFREQWVKLYAEPNKTLAIRFDADSLAKTLRFDGQLAEENTALNELGSSTYNMDPHPWTGARTTPDAVASQLLTEKQNQLEQFAQLKQRTSFSKAFYDILEG